MTNPIRSISFTPDTGDDINTTSHPSFFKPWKYIPVKMIQREQKLRGFKIFKHSHSMIFLGSLDPDLVLKYAKVLITTLELSPTALLRYNDWLYTYTYPRCTLVRWEDVKDDDWDIYRLHASNDLTGFISSTEYHQWTQEEKNLLQQACFQMLGRKYDIPQLLRWIAGRLFGVSRSKWKIIPDLFKKDKVCSVAVAYAYEYVRTAVRDFTGKAPWIRPFREKGKEIDIESTMPADFANSKSFGHLATNPAYE